jgi:hypothetical protein
MHTCLHVDAARLLAQHNVQFFYVTKDHLDSSRQQGYKEGSPKPAPSLRPSKAEGR